MKNFLITYFSFSKKEFNGILVLCALIIVVLIFPYVYDYLKAPEIYDTQSFKAEIASFESSSEKRAFNYEIEKDNSIPNVPISYFQFDPNHLSDAAWKKLGLSDRQIKVIKNYESKGGKFYRREDLKKIYSISESQYARLEPYIRIENRYTRQKTSYPDKEKWPDKNSYGKSSKKFEIIELNAADSAQLETLPGIGPAFAVRIIKYRNRLGGFHSIEQLQEVYGLDSVMYNKLRSHIRVDGNFSKIQVNTAVFNDLKSSPYLSYKQINAIINYRKQHGPYNSIEDFKKIAILNEEILRKIEPYLQFK